MGKKRNRGNGSGSIVKRRDDGPYCIKWFDTDKQGAERIVANKLAGVAMRRDVIITPRWNRLSFSPIGRSRNVSSTSKA